MGSMRSEACVGWVWWIGRGTELGQGLGRRRRIELLHCKVLSLLVGIEREPT